MASRSENPVTTLRSRHGLAPETLAAVYGRTSPYAIFASIAFLGAAVLFILWTHSL